MKRTALSLALTLVAVAALAADPPPGTTAPPPGPPAAEAAAADSSGLLETYGQIWYGGIQEAEWAPFFMAPVGPPGFIDAYSWGFVRYRDWFLWDRYGLSWPPNPSYQGWGFDSWYGGWYGWMPNGQPAWGSGLGQYLPYSFSWKHCWGCPYLEPAPPAPEPTASGPSGVPTTGPAGTPRGEPKPAQGLKGDAKPAAGQAAEPPKRKWFSRVPPEERIPNDPSAWSQGSMGGSDPWSNSKSGSSGPRPSPPVRSAPPPRPAPNPPVKNPP